MGRRFGAPLVAIVPIRAYAPRYFMKPQHGDPEEAATIAPYCGTEMISASIGEPFTSQTNSLMSPESGLLRL